MVFVKSVSTSVECIKYVKHDFVCLISMNKYLCVGSYITWFIYLYSVSG